MRQRTTGTTLWLPLQDGTVRHTSPGRIREFELRSLQSPNSAPSLVSSVRSTTRSSRTGGRRGRWSGWRARSSGVVRRLRAGEGQGRRRGLLPLHAPARLRRPAHPLRRFRHRPRAGGVGGEGAIEYCTLVGGGTPKRLLKSAYWGGEPGTPSKTRRATAHSRVHAEQMPPRAELGVASENSSQRRSIMFCSRDCRDRLAMAGTADGIQSVVTDCCLAMEARSAICTFSCQFRPLLFAATAAHHGSVFDTISVSPPLMD